MCGIAGIINLNKDRQIDLQSIEPMLHTMYHRGPDGKGIFIDNNIALGHTRLSILDLSENGKQPFISIDGRFVITFNGEIFNYKELRLELQSLGYVFRSQTDTEVLLYMYQHFGDKALNRLNGMFAFAILDKLRQVLFIARDRVGVKPLYYSISDEALIFASEPKAIFASGVKHELNYGAFKELLLFKYIAGEQTAFKKIQRLLPGHFIQIENGKISVSKWWDLQEKVHLNRERLPQNPFNWFQETFSSATQYRTISDVPIGLMLSGGLDSSSLAFSLHENGHRDLASFTVVFDQLKYNEGPLAKLVASKYGFLHHELTFEGTMLSEALGEASWLYDEPMVHQNDAQMLGLSKFAKNKVSVLLSGEGGDELMGGYFRYKPLNHMKLLNGLSFFSKQIRRIPSNDIVNRFDKLSRYLFDSRSNSLVLLNVSNIYPNDLAAFGISFDLEEFEYRNKIIKEAQSLYPDEPARQSMYLDLFTHLSSVLDRNDRMTMGASIECRVPFLDYRLIEMIPALPSKYLLPGKKGKKLLIQSIGKKLPHEIRTFRKLGFSVPWESYFRNDSYFAEFLRTLNSNPIFNFPVFSHLDPIVIRKLFFSKSPLGETLVRQLFMLDVWNKFYLNKL